MTNDPLYQKWRELGWRRKLSPSEEALLRAWLEAHPEDKPDWEAETDLSKALRNLPSVPVSSNFTSLVLQAAQREPKTIHAPAKWNLWRWLPRAAFAGFVLGAGLISYQQGKAASRAEYVRSVEAVSDASGLPADVFQDFEAIQALNRTPPPDEKLLELFQ
jgi:anti-sigma factor RsiW